MTTTQSRATQRTRAEAERILGLVDGATAAAGEPPAPAHWRGRRLAMLTGDMTPDEYWQAALAERGLAER